MATPNLLPDTSFYNKQSQDNSLAGLLKLASALRGAQQASSQSGSAASSAALPPEITQGQSTGAGSGPVAPQKLADMYQDAEQDYGLPDGYLSTTGGIESSHNPRSYNELSRAAGLMQFIPSTARQYGLKNPYDPGASIDAAARLAVDNGNQLRQALGREPTAGELYLAHQQGVGGAINLLSHPNSPAGSLVPSPRNISANGGNPNAPASQFTQKWTSRFDNSGSSADSEDTKASAYAMADKALGIEPNDIATENARRPAGVSKLDAQGNEIPDKLGKPTAEVKPVQTVKYKPGGDDDPLMKDFGGGQPVGKATGQTFTPGGKDDPLVNEFGGGPKNQSSSGQLSSNVKNIAFPPSTNQRVEQGFEAVAPVAPGGDPNVSDPGQLKFNRMASFISQNPSHPYSIDQMLGIAGLMGGKALLAPIAAIGWKAAAPLLTKAIEGGAFGAGMKYLGPTGEYLAGKAKSITDLLP